MFIQNLLNYNKNKLIGPIDLLILQGSPFCNIGCTYCYLPDRQNKKKIPIDLVEVIFQKLSESKLISKSLSVVWHAGEPLTVPVSYYKEIFSKIEKTFPSDIEVTHSFQTNGMLINKEWCEFFKENRIKVGLSIDGPQFIHDRFRLKRNGKGSFDEAMRGVTYLKDNKIDFHVIAVITNFSLDYPEEIFNFFLELDVQRLGLNIEETEGINTISSLNNCSSTRVRNFLNKIFELQKKNDGRIIIREFESAFRKIVGNPLLFNNTVNNTVPKSHLLKPYGILSIDCDGNFMTFSPELLGQKSEKYGSFILGNVVTDNFEEILKTTKYKDILFDINAGIQMCKDNCTYFKVCGGGAPSNKYYENGTFQSTETLYCKYTVQMPIDIVLDDLEKTLKR